MLLFHVSPALIEDLTSRPMFFSAMREQCLAWPSTKGMPRYLATIDLEPITVEHVFLTENPTAEEILEARLPPFVRFRDYDPLDFGADTWAYLVMNPVRDLTSFLPLPPL